MSPVRAHLNDLLLGVELVEQSACANDKLSERVWRERNLRMPARWLKKNEPASKFKFWRLLPKIATSVHFLPLHDSKYAEQAGKLERAKEILNGLTRLSFGKAVPFLPTVLPARRVAA